MKRAAQVIGMEVGDQVVRDAVAVGLGRLDDRVDVPRRVDHRRLVRGRVAEQVDVVLHRAELELLEVDGLLHAGLLALGALGARAASRSSGRSQRYSCSPEVVADPARQHEQQVGEAVQVGERLVADVLVRA